MKHTVKTLLGVLLALTMAVGLLPGMLSTAHAEYLCPFNHPVTHLNGDDYFCWDCMEEYEINQLHTAQQTHTHSWGYQANGSTVTATCTGDGNCDYKTNGITLTINAPSSLVCDGSAKAATISGTVPTGLGLATPSGVTYNAGDSAAPTEPGSYIASFSWGGKTASVNFTLTQPTPTTQVTCPYGHAHVEESYGNHWYCYDCDDVYSASQMQGLASGGHTHSWGYQASGSTVTATCTGEGNCDYKTNGVTLTISAPASLVCDGSAKAAAISGSIPDGLGLPNPSGITYNPGGSTAPTTAGTYTASFSWGGTTASVTFTLTAPGPVDPIATAPTGLTATYGQTLANVTLSNPQGNTPGTWAWADSTASVGDAGSHTFTANFTPNDTANYNSASADVTVNVGKKAASVTADEKSKTYGAADPTLTAVVTGTVGTDTINYTLSRAEGNNVGEYAISVNLGQNPNYEVTATGSKLTIGKKAASVTADEKSKTYGAADPTLTAVVTGTVGTDTINYTLSRAEGNNVGEYAINVNLGQNPNYEVTATGSKLTIGKKAATVTAEAKTKVYGSDDPVLTAVVTGTVGTDTINYTLSRAEGNDVGEYAINVTLGQNPNYEVTATGSKLTIGKKAASVTADEKSKTYGEADPELTAIVSGTVGTDTINYTLSRAEGNDVGEYAINVNLGQNPNYEVTATGSKLTIGKKAATVTAEAKTKVYGSDDPVLTAVVTGTVGTDTINYTLSRAEGNDVGEYAISVNLGQNPNYEVTATGSKLTIGKKAASVTADEKSKTYGAADPTLTAVVAGTVGTDTINYTLSRAEGNNVGEYAINVTLGQNPNYEVTATGSKLTIGKKAASVTADEKSKTYGEADPELTAVVSGTEGTDTINYTLSRAEGNNVGEYAINVTLGQNPNYEVTATGSKLTIGKKAASVTAEAKTKVYGSDDPVLTAVVTGTEGTDTINYTLSRAAGENVGEYAITVNAGENPDYDVTVIGSKLTVTRKAVTVTAEAKSKTYGDSDPDLTAIVDGAVGEDEIDYTLSRGMEQNVGAFDILVTLGQNPNYDVTAVNGKLTINPRKVTVKADSKSKTEGEPDPALTASVTGAVNSAQISYSLSRAEGEEAGTYTIYVTASANGNYNVKAVNGVFTVNAAPQPEAEPAPRTPAEVTVPVSGDDATANVTVTVEEGVAAITDTGIDGVLSAKEVGTVTVDVSALKTEITEVVIPSAMLSKVAEAVADEANSADGMEVKLTEGTIRFDAEAVTAIREQADGHDLHLKLDRVKEDELNKAQQEAVKDLDVLAAYDAYMVLDGRRVEQISAGKATVTLKVELREGQSESGIRIFTVDENGELTEVTVTFEDGEAKFEVEAFSKYIVTYDPTK